MWKSSFVSLEQGSRLKVLVTMLEMLRLPVLLSTGTRTMHAHTLFPSPPGSSHTCCCCRSSPFSTRRWETAVGAVGGRAGRCSSRASWCWRGSARTPTTPSRYTHTHAHTYTHAHIHSHTHTNFSIKVHTHAHAHTNPHTYTHTLTHLFMEGLDFTHAQSAHAGTSWH